MKSLLANEYFHHAIHITAILIGYVVVLTQPLWVAALLLLAHWAHQKVLGGKCILTIFAKKYGAMPKNRTFFVRIMELAGFKNFRKIAKWVDLGVKISLAGIVILRLVSSL